MRISKAFVVIGVMAAAPAAMAQESLSRPLLDVPADYQSLRPLASDWPPPTNTWRFRSTRYTLGVTGPIDLRRNAEERRLRIEATRSYIEALRGIAPSTDSPPASDAGPTGENAP